MNEFVDFLLEMKEDRLRKYFITRPFLCWPFSKYEIWIDLVFNSKPFSLSDNEGNTNYAGLFELGQSTKFNVVGDDGLFG